MGANQSNFTLGLRKIGAEVVFVAYNVSGPSAIISQEITSTTARFYWNTDGINYKSYTTPIMECSDSTRLNEFNFIRASYHLRINAINGRYIEFGLYPSNSTVPWVSWVSMMSTVNKDLFVSCKMTVSDADSVQVSVGEVSTFRYMTLSSPSSIANNAIYLNQEGSTILGNTELPVNVIPGVNSDLSNLNGNFMITVNIDKDGNITYDNTYMSYALGIVRLSPTSILIGTSVSLNDFQGNIMANINSNDNPTRNNGVDVEPVKCGILCKRIMNDMNFTVLVNVSSTRVNGRTTEHF